AGALSRVVPAGHGASDALRVPAYAVDHHRRQGVKKREPDEEEPGDVGHAAAAVARLGNPVFVDRQIDPASESGLEARAPDHVGDLDDPTVLELRQAVLDAGGAG